MELLLVLGIILALSTLGIASFLSLQKTTRLEGAANQVADLLRQARHSARTSGEPVTLSVGHDPTTGTTWISGLVRTTIAATTCDEPPTGNAGWDRRLDLTSLLFLTDAQDQTQENQLRSWFLTSEGFSGPGITRTDKADEDETLPKAVLYQFTGVGAVRDPRRRPWRSSGSATAGSATTSDEGLMIRLSVCPPLAANGQPLLPLLLVTESTDPLPPADGALAGLALRQVQTPMMAAGEIPEGNNDQPIMDMPTIPTWSVVGWVRGPTGEPPLVLSSLPLGGSITAGSLTPSNLGEAGGRWLDLALQIRPNGVELLLDGQTIASATPAETIDLTPDAQATCTVVLGGAKVEADFAETLGLWDPQDGPWNDEEQTDRRISPGIRFDNIALLRLGGGARQMLPPGIVPGAPDEAPELPTLVITPEGQVSTAIGTGATWTFHGLNREQEASLTIGISGTGVIDQVRIAPVPSGQ